MRKDVFEQSSRPRQRLQLAASAVLIAVGVSACTVIHTTAPDGSVHVERVAGIAHVHVDPSYGTVLLQQRDVGISRNMTGWTLGYAEQELAFPGRDCQAIFWVKTPEQAAAIRAVAAQPDKLCFLQSPNNELANTKVEP